MLDPCVMNRLLFCFLTSLWLCGATPMAVNAQINAEQILANGKNALYFEDYVLSIQYFNKVINAKPYLSEPYMLRGYAKFNLEDYKGALVDITKAVDINPYLPDAYNLSGIVKQKLNQDSLAIDDFTKGLEVDPRNTHLLVNRGNSFMSLKRYDKAIDDYNRVIAEDPKQVNTYLNRGIAHVNLKDTVAALADFTNVIDRNPYLSDGYVTRGILYYQTGDYTKALGDYDKAIELKPNESGLYLNRGVIHYQLDNLQQTMNDFDKVVELNPRNVMAYSNRGILRAQVGDWNRAIDDFSRVLALDPEDLLTLYNRALIYHQIGEYKLALNDLNVIIENYPSYAPAYYNRFLCKQVLNDMNGAMRDYNTAMKLDSDRRLRQDLDEKLARKEGGESQPLTAGKQKQTRSEKDKDISNYNKIAVLDDFDTKEKTEGEPSESIRGKVQNRDIFVDLEPFFGLSFYTGDSLVTRHRYFDAQVERFNRQKLFDSKLLISNRELEAEGDLAIRIFSTLENVNAAMDEGEDVEEMRFIRAILYSQLANYHNSLIDYNDLVQRDPSNKLGWFNRAYLRHKMVEAIKLVSKSDQLPSELNVKTRIAPSVAKETKQIMDNLLDYDLIVNDLDRVIELDTSFSFAYYNRGIIKCLRRDFEGGLADFSKAVELNPEFAEAYFNRGLTRIYLKQEEEGTQDLSKAGELGLFKAYNVIKRFGQQANTSN